MQPLTARTAHGVCPLPDPAPSPRPKRDTPLHRGAADTGQGGRLLGDRVSSTRSLVGARQAAALHQSVHPPAKCREKLRHLLVGRRRRGVESQLPRGGFGKHAIQDEGVEVNVQIQSTAEALDHGSPAPSARSAASWRNASRCPG